MPMLTPDIIAKEALLILSNNLVISSLVFKGDTSNFTANAVGDTITIRKPATFAASDFTGTITTQGVNETSVPLVLEKHIDMSIELSSKETTLELDSFSEQVIAPAMVNFAEELDGYVYSKYVEIDSIVGDGNLNAVSDLAAVNRALMEAKVPNTGRVGFVNPETEAKYLSIDNLVRLDTRGNAGLSGLTEASMGRAMKIDWYSAQGVKSHVPGAPGGTPTATGTAGAFSVTVAAGGAAGTYKKGDIVSFGAATQKYVVTADTTLSGTGTGTLPISPALTANVTGGTAINLQAAHPGNIVGHPRGLSVACVPLALPMDGTQSAILNWNGYAIRVVYGYSITTKKNVISFDCLLGAKVTDPRLLTRFNG